MPLEGRKYYLELMKKEIEPRSYCTETIQLKRTIQSAFLTLAERLYNIKRDEMWTTNWGSWQEYLEELDVSEATASKLIKVYEVYVIQYKIDEVKLVKLGWDSLYSAIPLIAESEKKPIEVVEDFSHLRKADQREVLREAKKGPCEHNWEEISMRRCSHCGKMERV